MNTPEPTMLQLYARIPATHVLGEGKRYALWIQGCPFRCKGCLAPASLPFSGGETVAVNELLTEILAVPGLEGITISGGEPFSQAAPLAVLTEALQTQGMGVIVYSGYTLGQLHKQAEKDVGILALLGQVDLLIDGQYVASRDDGKSLRGSSNQKLHFFSERYRETAAEHYNLPQRRVELHPSNEGVMLVGVPGKQVLENLTHR
jgi:anaerobic ribonucleoside-triphosphate reductase activating protein